MYSVSVPANLGQLAILFKPSGGSKIALCIDRIEYAKQCLSVLFYFLSKLTFFLFLCADDS